MYFNLSLRVFRQLPSPVSLNFPIPTICCSFNLSPSLQPLTCLIYYRYSIFSMLEMSMVESNIYNSTNSDLYKIFPVLQNKKVVQGLCSCLSMS